jgi:ferritin-like protein
MKEKITDEQARYMVDILKKKSELIKNFYYKIDKYRISGDRETYRKTFKELLEKEEIKVYGKKIE